MATVSEEADGEYRVEFDDHGTLNEPPEKYWLNLTDAHGNERTIKIDVKEGGGAELAATGVAVGGTVSLPTDPSAVVRVAIGGVVLGVLASGLYLVNEYVSADGETVKDQPVTGVEAKYSASQTVLETAVTLPTGTVSTETDPRTGEAVTRGYGWQYIAETTELTQAELAQVLRDEEATVYDHGNGEYTVIGRTNYLEEVVISIVGGTIMAASEGSETAAESPVTDPCGNAVSYDKEAMKHATEPDKKGDLKPKNIKDAIKNPFKNKVWEGDGGLLYYIKKLSDGTWYIVRATPDHPDFLYFLATSLTNNGDFFDSYEDARDKVKDEYSGDDIDC